MKFKNIPLVDIVPDPNQPRKFFDPAKIEELAADIGKSEVHTPITVRPIEGTQLYMLVMGERRYKASQVAGKKDIPAMVRNLTDEETLNLQLSENLNREGVHPLEEGMAFARLLTGDVILKTIAERFGRSIAYIHKRAALANLVEEAKQLFFSGKINLEDAQELSRIEAAEQTAILQEAKPHYHNLGWYCSKRITSLDKAMFKTNDAKLYPEAGACTKCPFNSANAPTLFPDLKGKNCTKASCFNIKTQRAFTGKVKAEVIEGGLIPVVTDYSLNDNEKNFLKLAKDLGVEPLSDKLYSRYYAPTEPEPMDSFPEWLDYQDYDMGDPAEEKAAREGYEEYKADWLNEQTAYQKELEEMQKPSTHKKQAFVIAGSNMGQTIFIKLKGPVNGDGNGHDATGADVELMEIEEKARKQADKDQAKLYTELRTLALRGLMPDDELGHPIDQYSLQEWVKNYPHLVNSALGAFCIYHSMQYSKKREVNLLFTTESNPEAETILKAFESHPDPLTEVLKHFIEEIIFPGVCATGGEIQIASYKWMSLYMPIGFKQTQDFHKATIADRQEKLEKRIEGIKKKAAKATAEALA